MNLTDEQARCVELYQAGESFAVEAGAGTGKTSTLVAMAKSDMRTVQYLAFNRAIVNDSAERFPRGWVSARTVHSLAWGSYRPAFGHRLNATGRMKSADVARALQVRAVTVPTAFGSKYLSAGYLASHTMKALRNFCATADAEPSVQNFPFIEGIDMPTEGRRTYRNNNEVARALLPALRRAWADVSSPTGVLRFDHAHYVKMWQLDGARIEFDALMVDEAQDLSPVMLSIVEQQEHCQRVFVGDSAQAIYGFTGAVNAIDRAMAAGYLTERTFLTQSFRFGPAIAGAANYILALLGVELRIVGSPNIDSTVGDVPRPDVLLTRSNGTALAELLAARLEGRTVHITGGADQLISFAEAAGKLKRGEWTGHPELSCFGSWGEVQEYAAADPLGDELALLVKLVDEFGVDTIIENLANMPTMWAADLVCSTAHKAKGLEWQTVRLAGDFPMPRPGEPFPDEEYRLLYVAATRAKFRLDPTMVPAFRSVPTQPANPLPIEAF